MSRYITRPVLKIAEMLKGQPASEPVLWGSPPSPFVAVPCPMHEGCEVYLNKQVVMHFYESEDSPFVTTTFEDFVADVEEQASPWSTTEQLFQRVGSEAGLAWVWHGFILPGNITLLSAAPKAGKTTLLIDAVEALLTSRGLLDRKTRAVDILYVTEESDATITSRITDMGSAPLRLNRRLHWMTRKPGMTWPDTMMDIAKFVHKYRDDTVLVVIDTMGFWMQIEDENDASQVRAGLQPLVDLARDTEVAVLLVHHNKKGGGKFGEGVRGSTAFTGNVDIILELTRSNQGLRDEEDQRLNPKRVLFSLSRYGETPEMLTLLWERGQRYRVATDAEIEFVSAKRVVDRNPAVVALLTQGKTVREVEELTGVGKSTVGRIRLAMKQLGTVFDDDDSDD